MIQSFEVRNDGYETGLIELAGNYLGWAITNIEGLGPIKTSINTGYLPSQKLHRFNSYTTETRNIVFYIRFYGQESVEAQRNELYLIFPPGKEVEITFHTDYYPSATITGYVESCEMDIFSNETSAQVSIICPDFRFILDEITVTNPSMSQPDFTFPFTNPRGTRTLLMSHIQIGAPMRITHYGSIDSGFIIAFDGEFKMFDDDNKERVVKMTCGDYSLTFSPLAALKFVSKLQGVDYTDITASQRKRYTIKNFIINSRAGEKVMTGYIPQSKYPNSRYNLMPGFSGDWLMLTSGNNDIEISVNGNKTTEDLDDVNKFVALHQDFTTAI